MADLTAYRLAKVVSYFVESDSADTALQQLFSLDEESDEIPSETIVTARTCRRWLRRMGFEWRTFGKNVYFDGHERDDVVSYRQNTFIPEWLKARERSLTYDPEADKWSFPPPEKHPSARPLVLVTHDESTFSANDGTRQGWVQNGRQPIRPKGRGSRDYGFRLSGFVRYSQSS